MPKTILIVDDEPDSANFIGTVLEDNGYEYLIAGNGREGLELVRKEKPDLITLDLIMPEQSGIMMFQELIRHTGRRPIFTMDHNLLLTWLYKMLLVIHSEEQPGFQYIMEVELDGEKLLTEASVCYWMAVTMLREN